MFIWSVKNANKCKYIGKVILQTGKVVQDISKQIAKWNIVNKIWVSYVDIYIPGIQQKLNLGAENFHTKHYKHYNVCYNNH